MCDAKHPELLAPGDPPPVRRIGSQGASPFLLTGDHAGNAVPRKLGTLGTSPDQLERHIGWDIGIAALGQQLARHLDALFLFQPYSRLVIDCNRDPRGGKAIVAHSDGTRIPANADLTPQDAEARITAIHTPYHRAISEEIALRDGAGRNTILIALHSFTPVLAGHTRPWHAGVLHDGHADGFARQFLATMQTCTDVNVGDNKPYRMDSTDYSVPHHCFNPDRLYAEIEIRQDQLGTPSGIARWSAFLARALIPCQALNR